MEQIEFNGETAYKTKYEGYYCTKSGIIISTKLKGGRGKPVYDKPREHCYKLDKDGYKEYLFSVHGTRYYRRGHRVVYETFNGDIPEGMTIDHIDFDKANNHIDNLRVLSRVENGVRRNTKHKDSKKVFYQTFYKGVYLGNFKKEELTQLFGFGTYDFTKASRGKTTGKMRKAEVELIKV